MGRDFAINYLNAFKMLTKWIDMIADFVLRLMHSLKLNYEVGRALTL